ncbi:MAG TPA: SRPBCC family protein [Steroidobacteraceae bacterium]|nr:SRPBCC family protein [Steroidobacteraceae bacterium]
MSIAPVRCSIDVKAAPGRAFELFAQNMGAWWPRGRTPGKNPHTELIIEPKPDGRWYERDAGGTETPWGKVLAWEPPGRLLLGWQLDHRFQFDPRILMEVEILFAPLAGSGTRVSLEHRNIEQLGADAESFAGKVGSGWPERMGNFAAYAETRM